MDEKWLLVAVSLWQKSERIRHSYGSGLFKLWGKFGLRKVIVSIGREGSEAAKPSWGRA